MVSKSQMKGYPVIGSLCRIWRESGLDLQKNMKIWEVLEKQIFAGNSDRISRQDIYEFVSQN